MKGLYRYIFLLFVGLAVFQNAAAQQAEVFYPKFPVLVDRPYNIVCEISIDGNDYVGKTIDAVNISIDGISQDCIRNVSLMYSGTMSVIKSRTTSFVLVDQGKRYGGGQQIWCDPDFVIEASKTQKAEGTISLPCGKSLVGGKNYMYISMEIDPLKIADLSTLMNVKVQSISVDGKNIDIHVEGDSARYLGSSVRQKGDDGVMGYRIPGLVTTKAGTLIAVYDIRYDSSLDLQNNVDIGVSRSTDQGRTWEKMRVAMDMGEWGGLPQAQNGIGDPAVLVDERTGEIFIIAVWTHGIGADRAWTGVKQGMTPQETAQLMICSSKDDGQTWSEPRNITSQIKQPEWYLTLQGPGRGITMKDGTLVFPIQYIDSTRVPNAGVIYSKDHGQTWHIHDYAWTNTTEAQVCEVEPGVLMLNMRDNRKTGRRVCITSDLGKTWTEHASSGDLIEPVCMASIISVPASENVLGKDILLFSNPATKKGRHHMTIKASLDGGYTWTKDNSLLIDEEDLWGYSCLTMIDKETVGIIYEGSTSQLVFQAIKLTDIIKDMNNIELQSLGCPLNATEGYNKGVSAPFCGSVGANIIVAGGANFPDLPVTEGGKKRFYDDVFTLLPDGNWVNSGKLPFPLAYGATYSLEDRVIIAGGSNAEGVVSDVYSIKPQCKKVTVKKLSSLPVEIAEAGFASSGNILYLAGGVSAGIPSSAVFKGVFDGKDVKWEKMTDLPKPMVQPVVCSLNGTLYVWGGCNPATGEVISEGYKYDPQECQWKQTVSVPKNETFTGSAIVVADNKAVVIGGVNKAVFTKGLAAVGDEKKAYMTMPPAHYKFNDNIWVFDPETEQWASYAQSGKTALAGAGLAAANGCIYIVGGEIKPGVRTPESWKIKID